jgi:hypothetical protein
MHRSSETIGKIAAALAAAQKQLENPEKTLSATITSLFPRETPVSFRYASLASGLDIVRKALGEQEIATIQCTAFDRDDPIIRLSTVLAHSSGEWVASDWPVCPLSEIAAPHRLGAALTYARRYALFALVGITGEDDLDAPDLPIGPTSTAAAASPSDIGKSPPRGAPRRVVTLSPGPSSTLRGQLLTELEGLLSIDDLTLWALRRLPQKNKLTDADARMVEIAYQARLDLVESKSAEEGKVVAPGPENSSANSLSERPASPSHEAAVIQLPKTLRRRDKAHLAFVASQPCLVCQRVPSDAHHLKFAQPRALGRKSSDEFTVPLCRDHHRELHRSGNERSFWANVGITPLEAADRLWRTTERQRQAHVSTSDPNNVVGQAGIGSTATVPHQPR